MIAGEIIMADYDYEVDVEPIHGSGARVAARLCNFAEGNAGLLPAHINWLKANVAPIIRSQKNSWVDLWGFASKKGDQASNQILSENRCKSTKNEVATYASQVNFNINKALGEVSSEGGENDNWGFWRRVEIYVFAAAPPPGFKPIPVIPKLKKANVVLPGSWLIIGVDGFSASFMGVSAGRVVLTLLNDKGEKYQITGVGTGGGVGADIPLGEWSKNFGKGVESVIKALVDLGFKTGDLQNISDTIKKLNATGSSGTAGIILKRMDWKANMTFEEITASGFFAIASGDFQKIDVGGEIGFIFFGSPLIGYAAGNPASMLQVVGEYTVSGKPWGVYTSGGVNTLKAGAGVTGMLYKTIDKRKL